MIYAAPARALLTRLALLLTTALLLPAAAHATGDVNHPAPCAPETEASPGFRAFLPDCRAYELVTPPYTAGTVAEGPENQAPPISPDGEHLLAIDFGAYAGTEALQQVGDEYGSLYEYTRTPEGWRAEPETPPATSYPFHHLESWSPTELGRSIWLVPGPLAPGTEPEHGWYRKNNGIYIVREGPGRYATIGPAVAPGHELTEETKFSFIEGVSDDLDHIVFTDLARWKQLWPGDPAQESATVERPSLYEYHGTGGGEPVLVGVANQGAAPWAPGAAHINEGAVLESDCGTRYDAVSSTGSRVLFTAVHEPGCTASQPAASEIYARVEGTHTVDISEPTAADCAACKTGGERQDATYAGASEDGSEVFFTTTQKLLQGAAGTTLYEYDANGPAGERVRLLAPDVTVVPRVAASGAYAYLTSTAVLSSEPNGNGESAPHAAEEGAREFLYAYHTTTHTLAFVAREPSYQDAFGHRREAFDTTRDGSYLLFQSAADLAGTGDTSGPHAAQLFEYDAATGSLQRVSAGARSPGGYYCAASATVQEGYECDGNTSIEEDTPRIVQGATASLAADGTVVFTSELPLAPGAVQGRRYYNSENSLIEIAENVYEYRDGQLYLIAPGDEPSPPAFETPEHQTRLFGLDEAGTDVFFAGEKQLVPQDTDNQSSWYDARVQGGFPAPPPAAGCEGEACQGAPAPAPPTPVPLAAPPGEQAPAANADPAPKAPTAAQLRAEKLARALKACRRKHGHRRSACERQARRTYGAAHRATASRRRGSTR